MRKFCRFTALMALLTALAVPGYAKPAADFELPTATATVSLSQYRGKIVYLDFWASWCGPCINSFPWMDKMQEKYRDQGVVFLAVNVDKKRKDADQFLAANPVGFTVAFDGKGIIAKKYELMGMPSAFVIDREGVIRHTHIGFNKGDAEEYETHIKELLGSK